MGFSRHSWLNMRDEWKVKTPTQVNDKWIDWLAELFLSLTRAIYLKICIVGASIARLLLRLMLLLLLSRAHSNNLIKESALIAISVLVYSMVLIKFEILMRFLPLKILQLNAQSHVKARRDADSEREHEVEKIDRISLKKERLSRTLFDWLLNWQFLWFVCLDRNIPFFSACKNQISTP